MRHSALILAILSISLLGTTCSAFGEVGDILLGRRRAPEYRDEAVEAKYLRVANVKSDWLALDDVISMRWSPEVVEAGRSLRVIATGAAGAVLT